MGGGAKGLRRFRNQHADLCPLALELRATAWSLRDIRYGHVPDRPRRPNTQVRASLVRKNATNSLDRHHLAATHGAGTVTERPHPGHFPFAPALSAGALTDLPQLGQ